MHVNDLWVMVSSTRWIDRPPRIIPETEAIQLLFSTSGCCFDPILDEDDSDHEEIQGYASLNKAMLRGVLGLDYLQESMKWLSGYDARDDSYRVDSEVVTFIKVSALHPRLVKKSVFDVEAYAIGGIPDDTAKSPDNSVADSPRAPWLL